MRNASLLRRWWPGLVGLALVGIAVVRWRRQLLNPVVAPAITTSAVAPPVPAATKPARAEPAVPAASVAAAPAGPDPGDYHPPPAPPEIARAFPSITEAVGDWRAFRPDALTVEPYPGWRASFTRTQVKEDDRFVTWIGRNPNLPGASLVGVASANGYDAILVIPGAPQVSYHVRGEKVLITEANPATEGCGNTPGSPPASPPPPASFGIYDVRYAQAYLPPAGPNDPRAETAAINVDVLFGYDAETLAAAGAKSTDPIGYIEGQCKAMIESGNAALTQSKVTNFAWRYLGAVAAPSYTRTGSTLDDIRAIEPDGAIAAWVKSTVVKQQADQFCLLTGKTTDGFAGRGVSPKQKAATFGYGVSMMTWGSSFYILVHELAHNFGCQHDRAHVSVISAGEYGDPAPDSDGYWCYGQLWSNQSATGGVYGTAGTIMSYADYRIPYFSNPNVTIRVTGALLGWDSDPDWVSM